MEVQSAAELVMSVYNLLLNRDPEPAGLRHWVSMLENGLTKEEFLRATLASSEFQSSMGSPLGSDLAGVDLIVPLAFGQLRVPAADFSLTPHLLKHRSWEPHISRLLDRTLKPSDVFLDVGANLGYFTVLTAPLVKQVIAFEPVPSAFHYCELNISLNRLNNVQLHQLGLWDRNTELEVAVDPSSLMSSHIGSGQKIRCVALDHLAINPTVIKMDIEGAEPFALMGMKETLARCHPLIVMELNRPALRIQGKDSRDIWDFFQRLGYNVSAFGWDVPEPARVQSLAELDERCPTDTLIDLVMT